MTPHAKLAATIDSAFEDRAKFAPGNVPADVIAAVEAAIDLLDQGTARVAEKIDGQWCVHEWLKKAVLLSFRLNDNRPVDAGYTNFYDKVPLKYAEYDAERFRRDGVRVVPPAVVRRGAYVAGNAVLMPSYVNIGAYVGEGTMVDTWATVGSCAQIGRNVHLSGGVGIGGVLEPLQASPTIIEDHCFIGARSEVVEGVIVEEGAVLSMGVYVGQSTRIYDRERDEVLYGRIPAGAVVVPGSLPAANGKYSLYCAVIVKRVDAQTRAKVGINELLRNAELGIGDRGWGIVRSCGPPLGATSDYPPSPIPYPPSSPSWAAPPPPCTAPARRCSSRDRRCARAP
jgi:2,3,4,5-tetrahydropyridine-2-carboxylate N-succinyltransferase